VFFAGGEANLSEESARRAQSSAALDSVGLALIVARSLDASSYPALVLETPSELIVAASPSAALLLDPAGGQVVGRSLEDFTADRPVAGPDLFAGGRLNGFEAFRVLRRADGKRLRIRMWIRSFADQPSTRFVLVVMAADDALKRAVPAAMDRGEPPAVVGTADASLAIERISGDAGSLFGWSVEDLVGRSLMSLVAEKDVPNCLVALAEASASQHGVAIYVDVRGVSPDGGAPSVVGCELLILPLHPTPSCAFVVLPTSVELSRTPLSADLPEILARLGRGAEMAQLVRGATAGITERDLPGLSNLTIRELEVLTRLLDGDRAPAIAADLFLSQGTVRNHLASIFSKVGVGSQQQLLTLFRAARAERR
jgi:DNA-binding CsgD family transcriptional regulator